MSNYANITLDTIAPSGVSVVINDGASKTSTTAVTLEISCGDTDLTAYQMKIWGISGAETESAASWETYQSTKNVTLTATDGLKKVYVKVRDDVWNESESVSSSITLATSIPEVESLTATPVKLSLVDKKNVTTLSFQFTEAIDKVKIMIVDDVNAAHDAATNIAIPRTNGSYMNDDSEIGTYSENELSGEGNVDSVLGIYATVYAADILAASPGDGVKIIKAFVRSASSGNWSV